MRRRISLPLSELKIYGLTNAISKPNTPLYRNPREAIDDFKDRQFESCLRKIGIASEALTDILYSHLFKEEEIPSKWEGKLNRIYKEKRDVSRYIVTLLFSVKWLRNTLSHPTLYKPSEEEAYLALLAFQIALEKYVIKILGLKVTY